MTFVFDEKYSFPYNDILKKFDGKFDKITKQWTLPLKNKALFYSGVQTIKSAQAEKSRIIWGRACEAVGVKFATKGTQEYDDVMKVFKELISSS